MNIFSRTNNRYKSGGSPDHARNPDTGTASRLTDARNGEAARFDVETGIRYGASPYQLSSHIDTMNSYYGMRGTLKFVKGLYDKRRAEYIHEITGRGLRGPGMEYPFMERIQTSFGKHDIGDLTAHTGPEAREANTHAGSDAYYKGRHVAFGELPTLKVAAHEAAHAVQGVSGAQLQNGTGQAGDRWEKNADAVADAVARGKSAEGLLDKVAGSPAPGGDAVQFTKSKDQARLNTLLTGKNFLVASNRGPVVKKDRLSLSAGGLATAMRGALDSGGIWISNSGTNPPVHDLAERMEQYSHTVDQFSPDTQHTESLINPLGLHASRLYRPGLNKSYVAGDIESREPYDVSHFSMDKAVFSKFYENVVNGWLWPVFHDLAEFVTPAPQDWEIYRETNQAFADALFADFSGDKENVAWIQDYQLLLTPGMLREKLTKNTDRIGFFLHIPFANPDTFTEQLGEAKVVEILHSLLQSDVVGVQMYDDAGHFIELVEKLADPLGIDKSRIERIGRGHYSVPVGSRVVTVRDFPISIDYEAQHETGASRSLQQAREVVKRKFDAQVQSYPQEKGGVERRYDIDDIEATKAAIDDPESIWIGGIERADYTKGLHHRVDAIDLYFKENIEELLESGYKPVFVLTLAPSRENVPSYKKYVDTLYGKINRVNQTYQGKLGYAPVVLTGPVFDPEKSDLFAAYDVFVITALSDGMNLTPLEVISTKHLDEGHDHRPAVFILSEGAGIGRRHEFVKHGYTLERTMEPEMIKEQLKRGIDKVIATREDPEKLEKLAAGNKSMQAFVHENEIAKWTADFMEQLLAPRTADSGAEFDSPGFDTTDESPSSGSDMGDTAESAAVPGSAYPYTFSSSDEISTAALAARPLLPRNPHRRAGANPPGRQGYRQNRMPAVGRGAGRMWLRAKSVFRRLRNFIT